MYKLYFWITLGTTIIIDAMALVLWVVVYLYAQSMGGDSGHELKYDATLKFAVFFTCVAVLLTPGFYLMKRGYRLPGVLVALVGHVVMTWGVFLWASA